MSFFRRVVSIRNPTSKAITHRQSSFQQFKQCTSSSSNLSGKTPKTPTFYLSSARKPNFQIGSSRRTYCVQQFRPSDIERNRLLWFGVKAIIIASVCFVVVVLPVGCLYVGTIETVPCTKRNHFLLLSTSVEKELGDEHFQDYLNPFYPKILPATHPHTARVDSIVTKVIQALHETAPGHTTSHLDGLHWEVIVVDLPQVVEARSFPSGKIVVFTGSLQNCQTDAELATIIAHEVAHVVARHLAEAFTKEILIFYMPGVVREMLSCLFSRRMEIEADYIGLILQASAGYDPRVAPNVLEKLGEPEDSPLKGYMRTHPSGKKRARLLADAKVMEEALAIYKEIRAGH